MTRYAFHFDGTRCTGCKTCEMACKDFKDLSVGTAFRKVYEVTLGMTERDASGCVISSCVSYPLSMSCNHCEDPACVKACPVEAYTKLDNGIVKQDHDKCIGCKMCIEACPYNAPCYDEEESKTYKCDMCYDRQQRGELPACVAACPGANIAVGEMEDLQKNHQADIVSDENSGTKPNFVITVDPKLNKEPDDSAMEQRDVEVDVNTAAADAAKK